MTTGGRIWFYYARDKQVGPLTESELRAAIGEGLVLETDYVYREGFTDWKFLKNVTELANVQKVKGAPTTQPKVQRGQRAAINELIVAHNDAHVVTGLIRNISVSGVFFETQEDAFSINDEVKITLKEGKGLGKPMHLKGVIVRQARDANYPMGYGLELRGLDEASRARIAAYVKRNQAS